MRLFPVRKPSIGVSLNAQAVTSVELSPSFWPERHRRVLTLKRHDLASQLVHLSTDENNISEVTAFARNLTTLVGSRRCRSVALSLSNQCAHIALLTFGVLPESPSELASLVRWRLEKDLQISAADCRLAYKTFQLPAELTLSDSSTHHMLVATMRNSVLAQYEHACEQAGLLPVEVGIQGLQLFDLSLRMVRADKEWFFASFLDEHFFFVAINHGCPFMLRSMPLPKAPAHRQLALMASIQYYDELCASMGISPQSSSRSLYFFGNEPQHPLEFLDPTIGANSSAPLDMPVTDSLRVTVRALNKDVLPVSWPASDIHWTSGLPALAALSMQ